MCGLRDVCSTIIKLSRKTKGTSLLPSRFWSYLVVRRQHFVFTVKDAISWARQCQELGAGTILPTSMDGDGTQNGYDLDFTKAVSDAVDLPVIASGGAGTLEHFYEGVIKGGAQILLAASVFHYRILSIKQIKEYLRDKGLQVRI